MGLPVCASGLLPLGIAWRPSMLFQCVAAVCLLSRAFDGRWAMVKALLAHAQAEGAVPEKKKGFAADGSGAQTAVAQRVCYNHFFNIDFVNIFKCLFYLISNYIKFSFFFSFLKTFSNAYNRNKRNIKSLF